MFSSIDFRALHSSLKYIFISDAPTTRDLIEEALSERVRVIAVPASRLDPVFFDLRTGLAGELLQKCANYNFILAVLGDVQQYVEASKAFRDLVVEANRGRSVWFLADRAALEAQLASTAGARPSPTA